jgi:hypothetical protein
MNLLYDSLRVQEQRGANWIVEEVARLLACPTAEEPLLAVAEIDLVWSEYRGWRFHVYLELAEESLDSPMRDWVLILARGEERAFRVFEGDDFHQVADHIRRFVKDPVYRCRWLPGVG